MIDKLTDIYINWCGKNNLPDVSADEQNRDKLTYEQKSWLSNFIEIWDYQQNVDYFIHDNIKRQMNERKKRHFHPKAIDGYGD
tara:strand:- start:29 stop:277 length:249 start_codon:yes stop_codon:yes gene_type:complete